MPPVPASDDFDTIFCSTDDEAVKSRLAISPPKIRSGSSLKASTHSMEDGEVEPKTEVLGRVDDQVDYELESGQEEDSAVIPKNYLTKSGYGTFLRDNSEKNQEPVDSAPITPAKASQLLEDILSKKPPKMDIDLPLAPASRLNSPIVNRTSSSSTTMPEAKAPEKKKISLQKRLAADKQDDIDRKASATEAPVKSRKVEASNNKHVNGGDNKEASKSEKEDSENLPSGYAKQNYDKMHVNAIEKKRLADTLKEGKELPVYLKAMGLYALAYSQFEHFGPDPVEKWKGLLEFSQQIEKKCAGYKNEITVGLCAALMAWTHQRLVTLILQETQLLAMPGVDSLTAPAKSPATEATLQKGAASMSLALTQLALHHDRVRQLWMRAVNLVPSLCKYGFCVYSPVEDLVRTIDRYI